MWKCLRWHSRFQTGRRYLPHKPHPHPFKAEREHKKGGWLFLIIMIVSHLVLIEDGCKHVVLVSQGMWLISTHLIKAKKRNPVFLTSHAALLFNVQTTDGKLWPLTACWRNASLLLPPSDQHEDARASELWLSCLCVCCRYILPSSDSPDTLVCRSADQTSRPVKDRK